MHTPSWFWHVRLLGASPWLRSAVSTDGTTRIADDPYLWLEDIHGAKAARLGEGAERKTLASAQGRSATIRRITTPSSKVLDANDRIPIGKLDHGDVFNFWQDAAHLRGIWRRTTIAAYANANSAMGNAARCRQARGRREGRTGCGKGADCSPDLQALPVQLSPRRRRYRGRARIRSDSEELREDGFALAEAKAEATYLDDDTILFGTDFGPGTLTDVGLSAHREAVAARRSRSPTPRRSSKASEDDVSVARTCFTGPTARSRWSRAASAFSPPNISTSLPDGSTMKLPLPLSADVKGVTHGNLIFTLRERLDAPGGSKPITKARWSPSR